MNTATLITGLTGTHYTLSVCVNGEGFAIERSACQERNDRGAEIYVCSTAIQVARSLAVLGVDPSIAIDAAYRAWTHPARGKMRSPKEGWGSMLNPIDYTTA